MEEGTYKEDRLKRRKMISVVYRSSGRPRKVIKGIPFLFLPFISTV